jgi:glycosyltransferase involved in cell wall biosynthesis
LRINFYEYLKKEIISSRNLPFAGDIEFALTLEKLIQDSDSKALELAKKLSKAELIILDNCYPWPFVREAKRLNSELRIVYSSHNLEFKMKERISLIQNWPTIETSVYLEFLERIERELLNTAELVLACSDNDRELQILNGARECLVVPNGGKVRKPGSSTLRDIQRYLGCEKYALFVASGHPPNVDGFLNGIGLDFGFMPHETRLVLAGSSANYIAQRIEKSKYLETFLNRGSRIDYASDDLLAQLYRNASVVILPIYEGGGTNIKTAEAFLNSRFVLTTSFALRGFDKRLWEEKSFQVVETQSQFRKGIQSALELPAADFVTNLDSPFSWDWIRNEYFDEVRMLIDK